MLIIDVLDLILLSAAITSRTTPVLLTVEPTLLPMILTFASALTNSLVQIAVVRICQCYCLSNKLMNFMLIMRPAQEVSFFLWQSVKIMMCRSYILKFYTCTYKTYCCADHLPVLFALFLMMICGYGTIH